MDRGHQVPVPHAAQTHQDRPGGRLRVPQEPEHPAAGRRADESALGGDVHDRADGGKGAYINK